MLKMEAEYLDIYVCTDLVKLILDYLSLDIDEEHISEIPDKYIGNITINLNKNKYNEEYRKLIRKARIRFDNIPATLINLTYLSCWGTDVTEIPDTLIKLTILGCSATKVEVIPDTLINLTTLYCIDTKVTVIPNTLINLTYLLCYKTNISVIPDTLINLTYLDCCNTNVKEIPATLINLTSFECDIDTVLPDTLNNSPELFYT